MTEKQTNTTETFIDPICGMQVAPATAAGSLNQDGETYYFCSAGCLQKFIAPSDKQTSGGCCCS
ncbi:MAG: YHS domain-containing protein [Pyrinomonadaceae bacterium]